MKFLKSKIILAGSVLVSLFAGAIFVSCHSVTMVSAESFGYFHDVSITQTLTEPCCQVQNSNHELHTLSLAAITPTTTPQSNIPCITDSPIWFQDTVRESLRDVPGSHLGSTTEVPPYSYLATFIAQGLLQPQIYNVSQASA